jgi:hypothetical protein
MFFIRHFDLPDLTAGIVCIRPALILCFFSVFLGAFAVNNRFFYSGRSRLMLLLEFVILFIGSFSAVVVSSVIAIIMPPSPYPYSQARAAALVVQAQVPYTRCRYNNPPVNMIFWGSASLS